ncbi:MAG: hypothetical protein JNL97_00240, partial [Verrucomicrobiales bacterium]|nr:hypothetical protein [Verrucomicrobiales bacterium]
NKHLGTEILLSREFRLGLGEHPVRSVGTFRFKGFDHAVEVFEPKPAATREASDATRVDSASPCDAALRDLAEGRIDAALRGFRVALAEHPGDGVARFYVEHCATVASVPPGSVAGIVELDSK